MCFRMKPIVISMNREQDVNPRHSYFGEPRPYENDSRSLPHSEHGNGLTLGLEKVRQTGLSICRNQNWEAALPWLEAAFFHMPECPDTTFHLSLVQARLGLVNESRSTAITLEDAGPNCIKTILRLCWLSLETLDWRSCRVHLNSALERGIPMLVLWTIQVTACIRSHQYNEAIKLCENSDGQSNAFRKQIRKIGKLLKAQRYDTATSNLLEIFTLQTNTEAQLDSTTHPTWNTMIPLDEVGFSPHVTRAAVTHDFKHSKQLARLRMESDFRKRFWIRQRLLQRDDHATMVLQELHTSPHSTTPKPTIQLPTPLKPQFSAPLKFSGKSPSPVFLKSGSPPFQPYNWLTVRQPWLDETARLERFATSSMKQQKAQTSYWTLTASHPERIVGLGSLTSNTNKEGIISVQVTPLVAHHRQETNLFITLIQQSKHLGLTRISATVEKESLEDTIIRRNGFRIALEEETLEVPLLDWNQKEHRKDFKNSFASHPIARDFQEDDWNQVLELIQAPDSFPYPATIRWNFPTETAMLPATFNQQLSTVIEYQDTLIGVLLVKKISPQCLHISLQSDKQKAAPFGEHTLVKQLLYRFVPLAIKKGFETVRFKRRVEQDQASGQKSKRWDRREYVINTIRTLQREEINP